MCGIYGQNFPISTARKELLERSLFHRGPDAQQVENCGEAGFFHSRLSIIDAAGGSQPMHRGDLMIVYNGEIYNHKELRQQFHLQCETRSDTETILALYEKLGAGMLPLLDGMFAFCIYHKPSHKILLARDRLGEKPLYYYLKDAVFAFGSELNTLAVNFPLEVDEQAIPEFLAKGWIGPHHTVYKNTWSLPPGALLEVADFMEPIGNLSPVQWWQAETDIQEREGGGTVKISEQEWEIQLHKALDTSVKRRVEASDLPVGCFLSGGLDSGIVTALASKYASKLHTFTFSFDGMWDETDAAALVAKKYETVHTSIRLHYDSLPNDIGKILLPYGQPFADDSAIPSYYIAREAKEFVTVVLNGDGGDEIFGGYRRYVPSQWPGLIRSSLRMASAILPSLPAPSSKMSYYNYAYRLLRMQQKVDYKRYLAATTDLLWEKDWGLKNEMDMSWLQEIMQEPGLSPLQRVRLLDYNGLLPEVLLPKIDIATMQHSLESRTVFLAPEVLSASAAMPDDLLVSGPETKRILRKLASKLLPASIATAPKRGFEPPLDHIVDIELGDMIRDYLLQTSCSMKDLLSQQVISEIFNRKAKMSPDRRSRILYAMFALEFWYRHRPQCELIEGKN